MIVPEREYSHICRYLRHKGTRGLFPPMISPACTRTWAAVSKQASVRIGPPPGGYRADFRAPKRRSAAPPDFRVAKCESPGRPGATGSRGRPGGTARARGGAKAPAVLPGRAVKTRGLWSGSRGNRVCRGADGAILGARRNQGRRGAGRKAQKPGLDRAGKPENRGCGRANPRKNRPGGARTPGPGQPAAAESPKNPGSPGQKNRKTQGDGFGA